MKTKTQLWLPITQQDLAARGWDSIDILIISGDAYIDHPVSGGVLIARWLESLGYRVGLIPQPDWRSLDDFRRLGKPRLFVGITSGNLDSMVAHYTPGKKKRVSDSYSPGGRTGWRPDRAVIVYANRVREAFGNVPIVIGGIEASLRRMAHYDYWDDMVRRSILLDSRADLLVFGMGERQVSAIAQALSNGKSIHTIRDIAGTAYVADMSALRETHAVIVPSWDEVVQSRTAFNEAFRLHYEEQDPVRGKVIIQAYGTRCVVQNLPALPLSSAEMDQLYALPFTKEQHPLYKKLGTVPGVTMFQCSITSHRGCMGECAFCSLYIHQGRMIQSRTIHSIVHEVKQLSLKSFFKGTVTDIGGPTANMYCFHCARWEKHGACKDKKCLLPTVCPSLQKGYDTQLALFKKAQALPGVSHVFMSTGFRYDLVGDDPHDQYYLTELCRSFISGQLKVAPEHSVDHVLALMNKPPHDGYRRFMKQYAEINKALGKKQYLLPYFISGYPGCTESDMNALVSFLKSTRFIPEQVQEFTPTPMTIATAMYYTGMHPWTGKKMYVARSAGERKRQRRLLNRENKSL